MKGGRWTTSCWGITSGAEAKVCGTVLCTCPAMVVKYLRMTQLQNQVDFTVLLTWPACLLNCRTSVSLPLMPDHSQRVCVCVSVNVNVNYSASSDLLNPFLQFFHWTTDPLNILLTVHSQLPWFFRTSKTWLFRFWKKQNKTRFDTLFLMNHTDNISHLRGRSKTVCFAAHSPSSASILVHIYPHIPAMTDFVSHFSSDLIVARVSWPLWEKRAELSLFLHWTVIGFRLLGISVLREAGQGIPGAVGGSLEKG